MPILTQTKVFVKAFRDIYVQKKTTLYKREPPRLKMPHYTDQSICDKDRSCISTTRGNANTTKHCLHCSIAHSETEINGGVIRMQTLSMINFKKICRDIAPAIFVFDTENQSGGIGSDMKIVSTYSDVIFMLNPNRICFRNECGTLCLNRVKAIKYHDEWQSVGKVFSIICGNSHNNETDVTYTIVADEK